MRAAPWRRAGGGDLSPLCPSPRAVPAQAPASRPRLSPRGPLSLPLPLGAERPYLLLGGSGRQDCVWMSSLGLQVPQRPLGGPAVSPGGRAPGPGARQRCLSGKPQLAVRCCQLSASAGSRLLEEQGPWAWCFESGVLKSSLFQNRTIWRITSVLS